MELEEPVLEPTLDVETSPAMEPVSDQPVTTNAIPVGRYWQAQGLSEMLQSEFDKDFQQSSATGMRERFYLLANYYTRTLAILRSALNSRRESLAQAALQNLIALHKALTYMHRTAPKVIPSILSLNRNVRTRLMEDLIVREIHNAPKPLDEATIKRVVNELDVLTDANDTTIRRHLNNLVSTGHLKLTDKGYSPSDRPYSYLNLDRIGLELLLAPIMLHEFDDAGYQGLNDVTTRKNEFRRFFAGIGFSNQVAALFTGVCEVFNGLSEEEAAFSAWRYADLIGSSFPRPYQYEAYAVFKGYGYQGQVIESPTGSGKTLIGMMCIQDWLRTLSQGQSILVLVPTVNYQQQWVGELCYKPTGLHLSPHLIFTGTPSSLEATRNKVAISPCVIIMTYTALAQVGSGLGKGGFDQDSIEIFLQGSNVQYIIFDEVHKVVEDLQSISASVTRLLTEWLQDGTFRGVIGFSGTASAYRTRFSQLGLQLVYVMPTAELIAYGFVAPFTEIGVPFAYSDREQHIRGLLDEYKALVRDFITLIGSANLRKWFSEIPLEDRVVMGRDLLRMYAGHKDQEVALSQRFQAWEVGKEIAFNELSLLTLVQIAKGWSDEALVQNVAQLGTEGLPDQKLLEFQQILEKLNVIRTQLKGLVYLPDTVRRLDSAGFGTSLETEVLRKLPGEISSIAARTEQVKNILATSITGLYDLLSDWYFRVGEGRVATIKAIIEAERATRPITSTIIFDAGVRIRWGNGVAIPGYGGVAGVFSQMLGDTRYTPMAALSREIYLPYDENVEKPLPLQIAAFIRSEIMLLELGEALFGLATQGIDLQLEQLKLLQNHLFELLSNYVNELLEVRSARSGEFNQRVLTPFRRFIRQSKLGKTTDLLLGRLSLQQYHIHNWLETFFDYALIAESFAHPKIGELQQVSGARHKFYIVPMAEGDRKQLMYDLTARIVDAETLPINMIIVSTWARTGWNVIKPNLLIDATATRNVTAWQQLRGRAMRARRTWTNQCYRLVLLLMSSRPLALSEESFLPEDVHMLYEELREKNNLVTQLDEASKAILQEAHQLTQQHQSSDTVDGIADKIASGILEELTVEERKQLVTELMLARNKVTHIYELVKAYGSTSQITYNRPTRQWGRVDSISLKHSREYAISPFSGEYVMGDAHAPLVYSGDPRRDVPSELQAHLVKVIDKCDPKVVKGWLNAII